MLKKNRSQKLLLLGAVAMCGLVYCQHTLMVDYKEKNGVDVGTDMALILKDIGNKKRLRDSISRKDPAEKIKDEYYIDFKNLKDSGECVLTIKNMFNIGYGYYSINNGEFHKSFDTIDKIVNNCSTIENYEDSTLTVKIDMTKRNN